MKTNRHQSRCSVAVHVTVFMLVIAGVASAYSQGEMPKSTAHGTLEVAGRVSPLDYAYAVPQRNDEMLLILSDQPLTDKDLKDVFERIHRADSGQIHCVELSLDAKRQVTSVSLRHNAFTMHGGGFSTEDCFEERKSEKSTVTGRAYRKSPGEFGGVPYSYDATFTASIWKEPPPTFSGAAARNSPQAKAALAFLKAGRAGDVAALKKTIVTSSIPDLEGPMGKEIMEMMKLGLDPSKAKITRVDVHGDKAEVTLEQSTKESVETNTVRLTLENGQWKVSPR